MKGRKKVRNMGKSILTYAGRRVLAAVLGFGLLATGFTGCGVSAQPPAEPEREGSTAYAAGAEWQNAVESGSVYQAYPLEMEKVETVVLHEEIAVYPLAAGQGISSAEGREQQKREAELEALKAAFTDMEAVEVYAAANVNARTAPSTEAEVYTVVKRGTVLQKNGEAGGWSRVVMEDGTYYIKSEYLKEKKRPAEGSHKIAIDAGHQSKANTQKEAIGPGASETKMKVTGGTRGTTTGLYEYELTLLVSEKLRTELENRGYEVYMVRESHDVDISNSERAKMAYDSGSEIFVRIHANGSENSNANGAMTICPTPQNPYVSGLYADSQRLSSLVLDGLTASTGCRRERVWETDTMSGINWSEIPVTIVEMGYMTNPEEDKKMAQEDYQQLIAVGIADGIDAYFAE